MATDSQGRSGLVAQLHMGWLCLLLLLLLLQAWVFGKKCLQRRCSLRWQLFF